MADDMLGPESAAIVCEFLRRVAEDQAQGCVRSIEEYRRAFPGYESLITEEYDAVIGDAVEGSDITITSIAELLEEGKILVEDSTQRVGPYRLLSVLGQGGMGIVYRAEQVVGIRREVALKVIRPGMDTAEVLARFETERQALALMNHPAIAKVFDAGETEDERPYFVMEYVPGVPVSEYCDRHKLSIRERLELFLKICDGVQHAHLRGVIHRDLKPTNILVACPDREPIVKIIDFGVAKSTNQRLTERTLYTLVGQIVGTPAYMSPEQARLTPEEIDHRTDVYSLGALLYELLVGEPPLDYELMRKAALDEVLRQICEEDPVTPSTRWSRLNHERTSQFAVQRGAKVTTVSRALRGELDWITMKALEKERTRRYSSAADLAADVGRYLRDEPVLVGPPSAWYRMRKFARRHRRAAGVFFTSVSTLILLLVVAGFAFVEEREERIATQRELHIEQIGNLLDAAQRPLPATMERGAELEAWLQRANELVHFGAYYKAELDALRENAEPPTASDRPDLQARIAALERKRAAKASELQELVNQAQDIEATLLLEDPDDAAAPTYYFRHAFDLQLTPADQALEMKVKSNVGWIVYVNGRELRRYNLPRGPLPFGTLAERSFHRKKGEKEYRWEVEHKVLLAELQGQLQAAGNLLAVEVHPASRRGYLFFDMELRVSGANQSRRIVADGSDTWRYDKRGRDLGASWRELLFDTSDWQTGKAPFAYRMGTGPGAAQTLRQEIKKLETKKEALEASLSERHEWRFSSEAVQLEHDKLAELVAGIVKLESVWVRRAEERLASAREARRRSEEYDWSAVIASIAGDPRCGGLTIEKQPDLLPLGKDPQSGLWEFCHLPSGEPPALLPNRQPLRDENGRLVLTEATGIIFVLIPGGSFEMGAIRPDNEQAEGRTRNVDPQARPSEGPVHPVELDAFLISKYEMTQGQWVRAKYRNPSVYPPGHKFAKKGERVGVETSLLHPVELVSWDDCREVLASLNLELPTEAQWEYVVRAGTGTVWWTGDDAASLDEHENIADQSFASIHRPDGEGWDDTYAIHAPVGRFRPNPFGLHDMAGNVKEWCRDEYGSYEFDPVAPGTGRRLVAEPDRRRLRRGGSFYLTAYMSRSCLRQEKARDYVNLDLGVRPAFRLRLRNR